MSLEKILPATCNYGNSTAYCNKWMPYIGLNRWGVCVFEDGVHLAEGAQGLFDHQQYSQLLFPVEKGRPSRWLARAPQSLSLSPVLPYSTTCLTSVNTYIKGPGGGGHILWSCLHSAGFAELTAGWEDSSNNPVCTELLVFAKTPSGF